MPSRRVTFAAEVGDVETERHGRVVVDVAQLGLGALAVDEDGLVVTEQVPHGPRVGLAGRLTLVSQAIRFVRRQLSTCWRRPAASSDVSRVN